MQGYGIIAPGVRLEVGQLADAVTREEPWQAGEKGLRSGALGMLSGIVIGVASTAPGYSLAASLGLVVAAVGLQAPAIMFLAFRCCSPLQRPHRRGPPPIPTAEVLALPWPCRPDPYTLRHRSGVPVLAVGAPDDA